MTFHSDVLDFIKIAERRLKAVVVRSTYSLSAKIIKQTPVDSEYGPNGEFPVWYDTRSVGEARGGWVARINGIPRTSKSLDPEGSATANNVGSAFESYNPRLDLSLSLSNDVPYIGALEFGGYNFANPIKTTGTSEAFSYQAPAGMVRINTAQWGTIVSQIKSGVR